MQPSIAIAPEALTITWVVVGSIILELFVLIVFLVRVSWWLSHRFTTIDANFLTVGKDVAQLKADISNDIAGRRVVAETRNDITELKTGFKDIRERVGRLEEHEDERRTFAPAAEPD